MTEQLPNETAHEENTPKGRRPTHRLYFIKDAETKNPRWLEIGSAWQAEGGSIRLVMDRLPYDGLPDAEAAEFVLLPTKP